MTKVLVYDLESAPNLGYTWGKWDQNVVQFDREWHILCFAYKWLGDRGIKVVAMPDFDLYQKDQYNDLEVVKALRELFDQADVTITHNGKDFDKKKAQARMVVHGLDPPTPYKEIDTLKVARSQFSFNSNSLKDLCVLLGLDHKADAGGFETWVGCMNRDPKAWNRMKRYNRRDVLTLEQLYERFRPWITNHPNLNMYDGDPDACPKCLSTVGMVARSGWKVAGVTRKRVYQCKGCRGYSTIREVDSPAITFRSA